MALDIPIWAVAIIAYIVAIPYVLALLYAVALTIALAAVNIWEFFRSLRKKR